MANDFLPFAAGGGANVMTQAAYAALAARNTGFTSGTALSPQLNKVWRQSSIMAAVLAQLIADASGNAIDDGTTSTLLAGLRTGVSGRLVNIQAFTTAGSFTYTPSSVNVKRVRVRVSGGGGAGGGAPATGAGVASLGGAGSAGSYAEAWITSAFSGVTVTVGAGGTGNVGSAGTSGQASSFGTLVSAPGGIGATSIPSLTSAIWSGAVQPGTPTGGNILATRGNRGAPGFVLSATVGIAGNGGIGLFGTSIANGGDGQYNAPSTAAQLGNSGAPGVVIVEEYE